MRNSITSDTVAGRVMETRDGRSVPVLDEKGHAVTVPAILSPDLAAAVHRRATSRKTDRPPEGTGRINSPVLAGLVRCSGCDGVMRLFPYSNGAKGYRCTTRMKGGECRRAVSISAGKLEAFVADRFLQEHGERPAYRRITEVSGAAELRHAEERKADALAALSSSATSDNFAELQAAEAGLEAVQSAPRGTTVRLEPTGSTVAETWEAADTLARRELLVAHYAFIVIGPGKAGSRELDTSRVVMVTNPAHPADSASPEEYRRGQVVV